MNLFWRLANQQTHQWMPLFCYPHTNSGFTERGKYLIQKPSQDAQLYVDDEPLAEAEESGNWQWEPGFYAGEVTAELSVGGSPTTATYLLDVSPDGTKLGRVMFLEMVKELQAEAPELLLGTEPASGLFGDSGHVDQPWVSFARLRRYVPTLMAALRAAEANPRQTIRSRRDLVPLHAVRRADRRTAQSASRILNPLLESFEESGSQFGNSLVDVPHFGETLDSPAHRALRAMQESVLRRIESTALALSALTAGESPSNTTSSLRARWPRRLEFLQGSALRLRQSLRNSMWSHVARADVSAAGLTAIAADPVYSRVWSTGWKSLRSGILGDSKERLWLSPSWEIYENWCYVRVAREVQRILPEFQWSAKPGVRVGIRGDQKIILELQRTFHAGPGQGRQFWSLSRERRPDILLTIHGGDGTRFLALDAKYRSSRENILDAMSSAHVYNDSLRILDRKPEAAILLIPRGGTATWLEDSDFHLKHRVGTHVFNFDTTELPTVVTDFLGQLAVNAVPAGS